MYIEVRRKLIRNHRPILIPIKENQPLDGKKYPFRSVYIYSEIAKQQIEQRKSTKNIPTKELFSDILFVDIDGEDSAVQQFGDKLVDLGLQFEYWHTGRRGGHFHVPIKPMQGQHVINSQKMWLYSHFKELLTQGLDMSIYTPNGQIRMPGAIHEKTGKPKKLFEEIPGKILEIPIAITPPPLQRSSRIFANTSLNDYTNNLTRLRLQGSRHQHIMIIVKDGISLGFSLDKILSDVLRWNSKWTGKNPLPEREIHKHVRKTYWQFVDSIQQQSMGG